MHRDVRTGPASHDDQQDRAHRTDTATSHSRDAVLQAAQEKEKARLCHATRIEKDKPQGQESRPQKETQDPAKGS